MRCNEHVTVTAAIHQVEIGCDFGIGGRCDRGGVLAALHGKAGFHAAARGEVDGRETWLAGG